MEGFDEFEGEEEVDYDFNLDEDFLNEGLEDEEPASKDDAKKDEPAAGSAGPSGDGKAAAEAPATSGKQDDDGEKAAVDASGPSTSAAHENAPSKDKQPTDKATEGSSGRKRIPIPVPDFAKGGQNGRQSQGHSQQPPRQHKVDASLQLERARFRAHMTKKLQETKAAHANGLDHMRRSQGEPRPGQRQQPPPQGGRQRIPPPPGIPNSRPPMGGPGGPGRGMPGMSVGMMPAASRGGLPILPMPPGMQMPGMGGHPGMRPDMSQQLRDPWLPGQNVPRGPPEPQGSTRSLANRFPSMRQYAPGEGARPGGLAFGMEDRPPGLQQGPGKRRGVWDRLGGPPKLAAELDAEEEPKPPHKRQAPGPRGPPGMWNPAMGRPPPPVGFNPEAELMEKARKEAEAEKLAEVHKRIEAQKIENQLIKKMKQLKRLEELAALQEEVARLEAAKKRREAAAAAASQAPPAPVEARKPSPSPEPVAAPVVAAPAVRKRRVSPAAESSPAPAAKRLLASVIPTGRASKTTAVEAPARSLAPKSRPSAVDEPLPSGDLREFLSQRRAEKKRGVSGEPESRAAAHRSLYQDSKPALARVGRR